MGSFVLHADEIDLPSQFRTDSPEEIEERIKAYRNFHKVVTDNLGREARVIEHLHGLFEGWQPPTLPDPQELAEGSGSGDDLTRE